MSMKVTSSSVRAKHTKLALSKALNVTINRAPVQASLRKMLKRTKGGDHSDLLEGFFQDDEHENAASGDAAAENTKADEALAQVILGVCEDTEVCVCVYCKLRVCAIGTHMSMFVYGLPCSQTHFESLVHEKHVNAEFDALDAWIQEAQENLLRKRARAEANGYVPRSR